MLVKMPYEPLPEDNFEFDEESRTITAYVGTAVDVSFRVRLAECR